MREPESPTGTGVRSDEEILEDAIKAISPHRDGPYICIYHSGRQIRLNPLTVGVVADLWRDALRGAYVAAMQELEPEMTIKRGVNDG